MTAHYKPIIVFTTSRHHLNDDSNTSCFYMIKLCVCTIRLAKGHNIALDGGCKGFVKNEGFT